MEAGPKRSALQLIGLAEVLLARGRTEEAYAVAKAALRGFVTLAEDHKCNADGLNVFLSAIEYFASGKCKESMAMRNSLIRLYGRLLNLKHAEIHDWDFVEHPILRSCILHGLSGGPASAMADLNRKCRSWRMNPDSSYVVTTGIDRKLDLDSDGAVSSIRPKQTNFRGVTPKLIKQRKSETIAEWSEILSSQHR
jgi:hypothetical protein